MRVGIAGGGVIGLALAFELAGRGASVSIFDRAEPGREASWAAAGMLAPLTERHASAAFQDLCETSLAEYPEFAARVREASGVDPELRIDGILHAAYDEERFDLLRRRAQELERDGHEVRLLERAETLRAEPAIGRTVRGSLLVAAEGHVDNRRLGRALELACRARGVGVHGGVAVTAVEFDERRVLGVHTELGYRDCDAVVNAAGAWAGSLPGVPAACRPHVRPVKGQMLALQIPEGFIRRPVWMPDAYVVPRSGGRLLIGATSEERADTRVTAEGVHGLLHAALQAAPGLRDFALSETWAGLRPATLDGLPALGPTPREGYFVACGHYRNGILLAPATARLLADAVLDGTFEPLRPFVMDRAGTSLGIAH
jgi:glycine oxidase